MCGMLSKIIDDKTIGTLLDWGSRGRQFKSGRPDSSIRFETLLVIEGFFICSNFIIFTIIYYYIFECIYKFEYTNRYKSLYCIYNSHLISL